MSAFERLVTSICPDFLGRKCQDWCHQLGQGLRDMPQRGLGRTACGRVLGRGV